MTRRLFAEGQVRPGVVVVGGISNQDPAQVTRAEYDDVIEAFSADRADQSLRVPILPR